MQYHLTDAQGIYTRTVTIDPLAALPGPGTLDAPPATAGAQVARLIGSRWRVLPERPAAPEPPPPAVPDTCTPAQGLVALYALKALTEDDIAQAIEQIPDPVQRYTAQIGFARATTWERGSATMAALAALLGLGDADLDDLFTYANGVQV